MLTVRGDSPKPRHGHAMAAVGAKVFLHGGMAGSTFYDDLHVLDLERKAWVSVKRKRTSPCARAAHAMVACGSDVFVFGGMNRDGALDDLHKLDTSKCGCGACLGVLGGGGGRDRLGGGGRGGETEELYILWCWCRYAVDCYCCCLVFFGVEWCVGKKSGVCVCVWGGGGVLYDPLRL